MQQLDSNTPNESDDEFAALEQLVQLARELKTSNPELSFEDIRERLRLGESAEQVRVLLG